MMRTLRNGIATLAIVLLCSASFFARPRDSASGSPAQPSIRVLLLDADSNKPRKRVVTGLIPGDVPGIALTAKTNGKGIVTFHLHAPLPDRVELLFAPFDFGLCSDASFRTEDVLKKGVVSTDTCKKSGPEYSGKPIPGELVVFGKKVSVWGWMLQEIP